jgi:hypothetical protein
MYLLETDNWYLERIIFLMAGILILAGTVLAWLHSIYWLILTALVGLNLLIFALTGFCPSANILCKMGVKPKIARTEK